ncbi:MAG: EAL domain-containing protein [Proteobacteria bacterium]|nr:EAL domain-containing protein [Pseudomonadota bacterium]
MRPQRRARVVLLSRRDALALSPATALERATGRRVGVVYQPIVAHGTTPDGHHPWFYVGAEALLRAETSRGLTVRPDQLLPVIERAGLLPALFEFVLDETLATLTAWQRSGAPALGVAVNLHSGALLDGRLPDLIAERLDHAGVRAASLTLEISESAPIADLRSAARTLSALRAIGVRVALDDFGAGFSTMTRLDWLECDELKIDRTLVRGLEHSEEQRCVVENLIALAHAHGMEALAEGVESEGELEVLGELGCDRAQGYLIARPQSAAAVAAGAQAWALRACAEGTRGARQLSLPGFGVGCAGWQGGDLDAIA